MLLIIGGPVEVAWEEEEEAEELCGDGDGDDTYEVEEGFVLDVCGPEEEADLSAQPNSCKKKEVGKKGVERTLILIFFLLNLDDLVTLCEKICS